MPHFVLTDEQIHVIAQANEPVEVRDAAGRVLTTLPPDPEAALIQEAGRRMSNSSPSLPADQAQQFLAEFASTVEKDQLDVPTADELLERMLAERLP